jgi:hypothetical protein
MIQRIKDMPIGSMSLFKIGLSTKTIERITEGEYALHSFVDGWEIEYGDIEFINNYLKGKI